MSGTGLATHCVVNRIAIGLLLLLPLASGCVTTHWLDEQPKSSRQAGRLQPKIQGGRIDGDTLHVELVYQNRMATQRKRRRLRLEVSDLGPPPDGTPARLGKTPYRVGPLALHLVRHGGRRYLVVDGPKNQGWVRVKDSLGNGSNFMRPLKRVGWYLVIPLAVAADAVTFPFQILYGVGVVMALLG